MAPRSIVHRPSDKMAQLLIDGHHVPAVPRTTSHQASFQPADSSIYRTGRDRPVIDGYYTTMKTILEPEKPTKNASLLDRFLEKVDYTVRRTTGNPYAGQQRELGSVRNLNETRRRTHGVFRGSHEDMGRILFPGCEGEELKREEPRKAELEELRGKVHGVRSNCDPTGGRTLKAIQYERCDKELEEVPIEKRRKQFRMKDRVVAKKQPRNFIANQDLSDGYLKIQEALRYLSYVRSSMIRANRAAVDTCRKSSQKYDKLQEAVKFLKSISSVAINYEKLEPLLNALNITSSEDLQQLWDLFDHNIPLSEFKIGRLIKPFEDYVPQQNDEESRQKEDLHKERYDRMEARLQAAKFKNYDTAADLIAPKPGTPFGLSHVDYFMPRTKEAIKTIFRNFELSEENFEDSWKQARKLESCGMNKVSAENFKTILQEQGVKLNSFK